MTTAPTAHETAMRLTRANRDPHLIAEYLRLEAARMTPDTPIYDGMCPPEVVERVLAALKEDAKS